MLSTVLRKGLYKTLGMLAVLGFIHIPGVTAVAGEYNLSIDETSINVIGKPQTAYLANGSLPAPTLHWREGESITLHVTNRLKETTSLHWHGIILPYEMDGVPGISFPGIEAGDTFTYRFQINQSGTYWYHGHSGMQEQMGLYGALIIDPAEEQHPVDRDIVIILSDWPKADPHRTLARLKKQSDYYNFQKRTLSTFFEDIKQQGLIATLSNRIDWGWMRMDPTDIADVNGSTYRFLVNGQTPDNNWTALFKPGEKIRLRFINASAMTYFDVRIPHLKMRVIEADGQPVQPVDVEEFRMAVAETYNVLVEPEAGQAYTIFAEAMDRSGYARATLTAQQGLQAEVPALRPMALLTMADMGGEHGGHSRPAETSENHDRHRAKPVSSEHAGHTMDGHEMHMAHQQQPAQSPVFATQVLTYQHLKAVDPDAGWREPDRTITLRLTGNMYRYTWSFDDVAYKDAEPIKVRYGERIRFKYVNETMMNHPIHVHGLWQYLDNGQGRYNPKKHVVNVKPGQTVAVDVVADAPGDWAFHCHLLYHMDTGMFRKLTVEAPKTQRP